MSTQRTILILTSKTGGGHVSLAEALRDRLAKDYLVEVIDPQPGFIHWHYRVVSRYALWLWASEFQLVDTPLRAKLLHSVNTLVLRQKLKGLLEQVQPNLIVTTYPFLSYEIRQTLEKMGLSIPLVMLFSDPASVHCAWLTERHAAATLAPTQETYKQALSVGFDPARLHLVGWPVREQFYRDDASCRDEMLIKLGLDPRRFTIFLQGGGEGAAKFMRTIELVLAASEDLQIILAAGTNEALLQRFQGVKNLYALPFTKEIAPFIAASDVVMGKAGPNTLFEAVTLSKPFIATAYIPGQEKGNLEFICRHQLGWVALKAKEQQALLTRLVAAPTELHTMTDSVAKYRQWNTTASETSIAVIKQLLQE
ncbi:MAG TPA: glycosyltransferase [Ktedonobacteraceae bacterium]|nr:glycosyltransferase [Ktedonobacteraceae bacterium]